MKRSQLSLFSVSACYSTSMLSAFLFHLYSCIDSESHSVLSDSLVPWTIAHQAPPSMGFSRQEYWSGLPFPSPGCVPDPGVEPGLLPCRQTLYHLSHQGSPSFHQFCFLSYHFSFQFHHLNIIDLEFVSSLCFSLKNGRSSLFSNWMSESSIMSVAAQKYTRWKTRKHGLWI